MKVAVFQEKMCQNRIYDVYNFVFPYGKDRLEIGDYVIEKRDDYDERVEQLNYHINPFYSCNQHWELSFKAPKYPRVGGHAVTSKLFVPAEKKKAVFAFNPTSSLPNEEYLDLQILLSLAIRRSVVITDYQPDGTIDPLIKTTSRLYFRGCTLSYLFHIPIGKTQCKLNEVGNAFEENLNIAYNSTRNDEWLKKYNKGMILLFALNAIQSMSLTVAFSQMATCWDILYTCITESRKSKPFDEKMIRVWNDMPMLNLPSADYCIFDLIRETRNDYTHDGWATEGRDFTQDQKLKASNPFISISELLIAVLLGLEPKDELEEVNELRTLLDKGK